MKLIRKLDECLLTATLVGVIAILAFAASSFLLPTDYIHIPLGFIFSGVVISGLYIMSHFLIMIDVRRASAIFSVISIALRLVVITIVLILMGLMYYRWGIKLFNIFTFVGIYTVGVIIFALLHIIRKQRKE